MDGAIGSPKCSKGDGSNHSDAPKKGSGEMRSDEDFYFGKIIGEGSFSSVYLAKDIHTGKEYAIKTCEKALIMKEKKRESIVRERQIMDILNSNQCTTAPFFVKLSYAFQSHDKLYFVMSYCKNGELLKWIKQVGNFDRRSAAFYTAELLRSLEHLHSLHIIHRDLKPENILLDHQMHIKITDFGSARILSKDSEKSDSQRRSSFVGTAQYVSPEVLETKIVTRTVDLWALGCIIYQMVSGLPPFNQLSDWLIFKQIQKLDYEFPEGFDEDAKDLVKRLLVINPTDRIGANDGDKYNSIRSHNFLKDLDCDTLHTQEPPKISPFMPEMEEKVLYGESPGLLPEIMQRMEITDLLPASQVGKTPVSNTLQQDLLLSADQIRERLVEQEKTNIYHKFVEGRYILKQGFLDKRKGLFPRKRMFLLTIGPKLYYVDSTAMVLKGQVPWGPTLQPEPKNFRTFFVHTPNRTYYLIDHNGTSDQWCEALTIVRDHYYPRTQKS